jgi:hypothetical protein
VVESRSLAFTSPKCLKPVNALAAAWGGHYSYAGTEVCNGARVPTAARPKACAGPGTTCTAAGPCVPRTLAADGTVCDPAAVVTDTASCQLADAAACILAARRNEVWRRNTACELYRDTPLRLCVSE